MVGRASRVTVLLASSARTRKAKPKDADLARRLESLTAGLTVARVLKADDRELVVELEDGTRLLVRSGAPLDISVT